MRLILIIIAVATGVSNVDAQSNEAAGHHLNSEAGKMLRTGLLCVAVALAGVGLTGCGSDDSAAPTGPTALDKMKNSGLEEIKNRLKPVATSGIAEPSGMFGLDQALKNAGKEELAGEIQKMMDAHKAGDAEAVKKLATDLLSKL